MMMRSIYGLTWRSLRANPLRSLLGLLAVALGVAVTMAGSMIVEALRSGVLLSDELRSLVAGMIDMLDPAMLFIGMIIMLAAGFLIFNTFGMSVTHRRQQIGGLRALGMTRAQITRVILAEALVLGFAGTLLGLLLGTPVGQVLIAFMKQVAGTMVAFGAAAPTLPAVIIAVLLGLVVTPLSALLPARRAARVAPLDALREPQAAGIESAGRGRTLLGTGLLVGVFGIVLLAPPGEWVRFPLDALLTLLVVVVWFVALLLLLPALIGLTARAAGRLLHGASGRLISDNLQRARGRVTLTVVTLMLAVLVLVALTGFLEFYLNHGFSITMERAAQQQAMFVTRIDIMSGWGTIVGRGLDTVLLTDDELAGTLRTVEGRAEFAPIDFVIVPEVSFMGSAYFSYMADADLLRSVDTALFTFTEGNWETALPVMRAGCGLLLAPAVAARNNAGLGDTIMLTGLNDPVPCQVVGIGMSAAGASIISATRRDDLTTMNPALVLVVPHVGIDYDALLADLHALQTEFPELSLIPLDGFLVVLSDAIGMISTALNGMLLLATFAAAFGVVNTMLMSIDERRREIGLLRAVGTTRAQTRRVLLGEAALMGVVGGLIGFLAGLGVVIVIVLTYGGSSIGVELDLRQTALASAQVASGVGLVGLVSAPVIAALAAWLPARAVLREMPVETLALR